MDVSNVLVEILRRKRWLVVVALVALAVATASLYRVHLFPPSLEKRSVEIGAATGQLLLDTPRSSLGTLDAPVELLAQRAIVLSGFMATEALRGLIAKEAGVPVDGLDVTSSYPTASGTKAGREAGALERANDLRLEGAQLRLFLETSPELPIITITSVAGSGEAAVAGANAAARALDTYIRTLQEGEKIRPHAHVEVKQLGPARGGLVNSGASKSLAALVFVAVLLIGCVAVLLVPKLRGALQASRTPRAAVDDQLSAAFPSLVPDSPLSAEPRREGARARAAGFN